MGSETAAGKMDKGNMGFSKANVKRRLNFHKTGKSHGKAVGKVMCYRIIKYFIVIEIRKDMN